MNLFSPKSSNGYNTTMKQAKFPFTFGEMRLERLHDMFNTNVILSVRTQTWAQVLGLLKPHPLQYAKY